MILAVAVVSFVVLIMAWAAWVQVMDGHLAEQRAVGLALAMLIIPVATGLAWLLTPA